jgi:pimeloyl-ACP methyl ester carboxylesterase
MSRVQRDYSAFDHPSILQFLFHPRPEWGESAGGEGFQEFQIPVVGGDVIGARFYGASQTSPTILFFHGNGEIVADYSDLGPYYGEMGINFFPVDYRGYGRSSGTPTVSTMMDDCHDAFEFACSHLKTNGFSGPMVIMGRSLGSASALELAESYPDRIDGLIIESGFAFALPLLQLIGINVDSLGITEADGFSNFSKIKGYSKPTLIIHAEFDHIIPFSDGKYLYENSPADEKHLLMIPGANHNDIFAVGLREYMKSIQLLLGLVANG